MARRSVSEITDRDEPRDDDTGVEMVRLRPLLPSTVDIRRGVSGGLSVPQTPNLFDQPATVDPLTGEMTFGAETSSYVPPQRPQTPPPAPVTGEVSDEVATIDPKTRQTTFTAPGKPAAKPAQWISPNAAFPASTDPMFANFGQGVSVKGNPRPLSEVEAPVVAGRKALAAGEAEVVKAQDTADEATMDAAEVRARLENDIARDKEPLIARKNELYDEYVRASAEIAAESQRDAEEYMQRIEERRKWIQKNPLTAGRVFQGVEGTLAGIGAALATAVQEFVSIQTGRPNAHANLIENLIQRDLQVQEAQLEGARKDIAEKYTAIGQLRELGLDKQEAAKVGLIAGLDQTQVEVEKLINQYQGRASTASLIQLSAELEQKKAEHVADLVQFRMQVRQGYDNMQLQARLQQYALKMEREGRGGGVPINEHIDAVAPDEKTAQAIRESFSAHTAVESEIMDALEVLQDKSVNWGAVSGEKRAKLLAILGFIEQDIGSAPTFMGMKQQTQEEILRIKEMLDGKATDWLKSRDSAAAGLATILELGRNKMHKQLQGSTFGYRNSYRLPQSKTHSLTSQMKASKD